MLAKTTVKLQDFQDPRHPAFSVDIEYQACFHGTNESWKCELSSTEETIQVWNTHTEYWETSTLSLENLPAGFQLSIQGKALEKAAEQFIAGEVSYGGE